MRRVPDGRWRPVPAEEMRAWTERLRERGASLFQLPYWNEPLRALGFRPRYLVFEQDGRALAWVCLLAFGVPGARVGLVQRGPVALTAGGVPAGALRALGRWSRRRGYIFLRWTHTDATVLEAVAALPNARRLDAFPFYRDPREALLVPQEGSDEEVFGRLQAVARRNVRGAERDGYTVSTSESPEALRAVWSLFEELDHRKGLRHRPLASFEALLREAGPLGAARVYVAAIQGRPVAALLVVRGGDTAHYITGALAVDRLDGRESPSALLHWRAMRDFAHDGATMYDLGTRSGPVHQFKRKFRPREVSFPDPVTLVTNRVLYPVWSVLALRFASAHWRTLKRAAAAMLGGRRAAAHPA